jgi:AcrR family transcriptional regulator
MEIQTDTATATRNTILQRARELFFTHGYSNVLMADLARQLSMSKKTLYQYFDGKEDLFRAVLKEYLAEGQREIERILQDDQLEFQEKLSQVFSYFGSRLLAVNSRFIADIKKNAPAGWQLLQDYKKEAAYLRFNALLEEGVQKGYLRKDINRPLAVILYASALETIFNPDFTSQMPPKLIDQMPDSTAGVFDGLVTIILEGVLKK